ncbi:MAG: YkgJ family cysteine cluster protein [Nannocystis sp.]|jgi:Fe-S-cluster containining protein|nr:YkgJ family cysteine cluster protein [Nannocystis sp.]
MRRAHYRVGPITQAECMRCGACCQNPPQNRAEGFLTYIEVSPRDAILKQPALVRRFVVAGEDGAPHLRLDADGRCLALRGRIGGHVKCSIYAERPTACRRVQPDSAECRRARAAFAMDPPEEDAEAG